MGDKLVKIIPFEHPLTLLDLQLIEDELSVRKDEDRDIVIVCLGKETRVDPDITDRNKKQAIRGYFISDNFSFFDYFWGDINYHNCLFNNRNSFIDFRGYIAVD